MLLLSFSTVLLFLITILISTEAVFVEKMWVVHQNDPGGSATYRSECEYLVPDMGYGVRGRACLAD